MVKHVKPYYSKVEPQSNEHILPQVVNIFAAKLKGRVQTCNIQAHVSNHLQNDIPNPEKMLQQFLNHNEQHTLDVELGLEVYYLQGLLYYQPKQCIIIREIPENYHRFLLFVSPKMGNIMIPVSTVYVFFLGGRISY